MHFTDLEGAVTDTYRTLYFYLMRRVGSRTPRVKLAVVLLLVSTMLRSTRKKYHILLQKTDREKSLSEVAA